MKKVDAGIKMIDDFDEPLFCWPVDVVGLKELQMEFLLKGDVFSKSSPEDRELFEKAMNDMGFSRDELKEKPLNQLIDEAIERKNSRMKQWGEFFKGAYRVHKKYSVSLFF